MNIMIEKKIKYKGYIIEVQMDTDALNYCYEITKDGKFIDSDDSHDQPEHMVALAKDHVDKIIKGAK